MSAMMLRLELLQFWHCGGSRGGGAVLDARVHRDADGLPLVPGRHLKGLLRAALESAESWGWDGYKDVAANLFGDRTEGGHRDPPQAGCLRVSDAALPPDLAAWLSGTADGRARLPHLFRSLHATAIDPASGTALDHSLRAIEVVVPLTLECCIEVIDGRTAPDQWQELLGKVLPLVTAIGAHRSRGIGRARLQNASAPDPSVQDAALQPGEAA